MGEIKLGEKVKLVFSGECGLVIGKVIYVNNENSYLVRYLTADGRQDETWWSESAIVLNNESNKGE